MIFSFPPSTHQRAWSVLRTRPYILCWPHLIASGSRRSGSQHWTLFPPFIPPHSRFLKKKYTLFLFLNLYLNVVQASLLLQLSCWLMQKSPWLLTNPPTVFQKSCLRNPSLFLQLPIGVLESTILILIGLSWVFPSVSKVPHPCFADTPLSFLRTNHLC